MALALTRRDGSRERLKICVILALAWLSEAAPSNPAEFGFDPAAEPSVTAVALQKALDGGNREVAVTKPGTYGFDRTVFIDSPVRNVRGHLAFFNVRNVHVGLQGLRRAEA